MQACLNDDCAQKSARTYMSAKSASSSSGPDTFKQVTSPRRLRVQRRGKLVAWAHRTTVHKLTSSVKVFGGKEGGQTSNYESDRNPL